MPVIVANYQKKQTVTKLQKVFSTFSQAINRSIADNGPIDEWYSSETQNNAINYFNTYFRPYLQITPCSSYSECGYSKSRPWSYSNNAVYDWYLSGTSPTRDFFHLNDGVFVAIKTGHGGASDGWWAYDENATIIIDLNGGKGPNKFGRDVFVAQAVNDKGLVPACYDKTENYVKSMCIGTGSCCLRKIIQDSWEIKDDYPW